jgi:hypothetical protein
MKGTTLAMALISSTVALVALVYGVQSHWSSHIDEAEIGQARQAHQTASVDTELNGSTEAVPQRSLDGDQSPTVSETLPATDYVPRTNFVDADTDRKMVREEATLDIQRVYPFLLEGLDLTASETDALLSFLIEDLIARTRTRYASGIGMDEHERSNKIAAIIGDFKLQQFLALERNRREYSEIQKVGSMLQEKGVPLSDTQRDELLKILVTTRNQIDPMLPVDSKHRSMETFELILTLEDDYDRLVMELAPSVLSSKQVEYLFERYQTMSYKRAYALEWQKQQRADDPARNLPLMYPSRN